MKNLKLARLTGEIQKLVVKFLRDYETKNLNGKRSNSIDSPGLNINSDAMFSERLFTSSVWGSAPVDFRLSRYSFKIGNVSIKNPVITAPLAGITDSTYRIFARVFGAALTFTEMISCYGVYYKQKKSLVLSQITGYERPCALQLFGTEPDIMAEAALRVEENADIIDINMGCPVPKILKAGSGGYLLNDESKIEGIITKLSSVLKKPLTIKTRIGWDRSSINILNVARMAENAGAAAISIHGRTVRQGFSGKVDYGIIKEVKEKVKIPVIVSGDINSCSRAKEVLDYTGCDGIMIGRASRGRLWLLTNILISFYGDSAGCSGMIIDENFEPGIEWRREFSKLYLKFLIYFKGEDRGVREFRKHLSWIFKGVRGINKARGEMVKIGSFDEAVEYINRCG